MSLAVNADGFPVDIGIKLHHELYQFSLQCHVNLWVIRVHWNVQKWLGTPIVTTFIPSNASIVEVMNTLSGAKLGKVVSSLFVVCLFVRPYAHNLPLMYSFIFFFRNISDDRSSLRSSFERSLACIGLKVDMSCICCIYFCVEPPPLINKSL